ncbi:MerR family transcriptional regulator [Enterococcus cecorum]|uniref:MerR family transcriptional regulator n=1 Tax=Enterococcus cecorum TaxID=44008 RepID=A0AAW9K1S9_9ENTE|nr:MerR family transcriptional regulator [Enterococcus cecorum]MDZ5504357.1 MerR family transcriptional regulator [Enterococcus cecorum]MDZ5531792.1 MerR family transcriptional regulator [Enterococcus cecorum]MDZ5545290.1 MerR family transcriptional regulator [Enterococcus cecorum]MDZ5550132.1 MerR family transcriptional regulator [Enterococcus cecorum]MDZ5552140.1 MerR family transcriptional regulator [Enterococcus cecorum]
MSTYTIKDAAKLMNVPPSTIRYYDKEGLIPSIKRKETGYRIFTEEALSALKIIDCLKKNGMPIKDIRQFFQWIDKGDDSLEERYEMFLERKAVVEEQIAELQQVMDTINYKCWYYETALKAGTEAIHKKRK